MLDCYYSWSIITSLRSYISGLFEIIKFYNIIELSNNYYIQQNMGMLVLFCCLPIIIPKRIPICYLYFSRLFYKQSGKHRIVPGLGRWNNPARDRLTKANDFAIQRYQNSHAKMKVNKMYIYRVGHYNLWKISTIPFETAHKMFDICPVNCAFYEVLKNDKLCYVKVMTSEIVVRRTLGYWQNGQLTNHNKASHSKQPARNSVKRTVYIKVYDNCFRIYGS